MTTATPRPTATYEPFSREPEYLEVNQRFVDALGLGPCTRVLDLASGNGTLTRMLLRALAGRGGPPPRVVDLDLSLEMLALGREELAGGGAGYVRATAGRLPLRDGAFDAVVTGNAIQLFPDKPAAVREVHRVLRPRGAFAFNTSFYAGTFAEGTQAFYLRWAEEALACLRRESAAREAAGGEPIRRRKGTADPAFSLPWLSADEYAALLGEAGFEVERVEERTVPLTQRCFEAIGGYAGLATVVLSGYPVAEACEALERAAGPALEAVGMQVVPRRWLEMAARKR